jgi:PPOX class probable F420-dependent enzyme
MPILTPSHPDALTPFVGQQFMNLETFRKSGVGVATPVWFIEEGGLLYVTAPSHTGKVKRLRNSSRARVVPCDAKGAPLGEWREAEAVFVEGQAAEHAEALLSRKYGFQKRLIDAFGWLRRWRTTIIAVRVDAQ